MIGLDTKVIVRYVIQDDPTQSPKTTRLVERLTRDQPGLVSRVTVVEVVWVLSASYRLRSQGGGHDARRLNIRPCRPSVGVGFTGEGGCSWPGSCIFDSPHFNKRTTG